MRKSFQSDGECGLFHCISILDCEIFKILILGKLEDLWCHNVDTKWCEILTKHGISVQKLSLQHWNFARLMCVTRTTHCDIGYDVTIARYLLQDLYCTFPKWKLPYLLLQNRLSCASAVKCPYSHTPTEWTTRTNNNSWRRETLILSFEWRGSGAQEFVS